MSYSFNGKTYMTVNGVIKALCKDSNATECGMVDGNHQITTYTRDAARGCTVAQVYDVTPPKFGQLQFITRAAIAAKVPA